MGPKNGRRVTRLGKVLRYAVAQAGILKDRRAGWMHLTIFWGFVLLLIGTALSSLDYYLSRPREVAIVGRPGDQATRSLVRAASRRG